jgi:predicted O-methyltransferase YrrM
MQKINNNQILEILEKHNINGFDKPGTDKASDHSYDKFYSKYLSCYCDKEGSLLEIGVAYGGSSLMWQEFLPKFKLVMVDVGEFMHPSIKERMDTNRFNYLTGKDAFNIDTLEEIKSLNPDGFDIIIEDGPHTVESQIFAIQNYSKLLKSGGILIIEDIQSFEASYHIMQSYNKQQGDNVYLCDLRANKGRYDDLLVVLVKG